MKKLVLMFFIQLAIGAKGRDICTKSSILQEYGVIHVSMPKSVTVTADVTAEMELSDNFGKA